MIRTTVTCGDMQMDYSTDAPWSPDVSDQIVTKATGAVLAVMQREQELLVMLPAPSTPGCTHLGVVFRSEEDDE